MAIGFSGQSLSTGNVRIDWHGDEVVAAVKREMNRRIAKCLEMVKKHIIDRSQTPVVTSGHSKPNEYPHLLKGQFVRSLVVDVDEASNSGELGSTSPEGQWLEEGTQDAGIIFPVRKKVLSWVSYPGGQRHFSPYIVHKGIEPRHPFDRAFMECRGRIIAIMSTYITL